MVIHSKVTSSICTPTRSCLVLCTFVVMVVVVAIILLLHSLHPTVETIYLTTCSLMSITLKLNGGMTDMILLAEHRGESLQNRRTTTRRKIINQRMTRKRIHPIGNTPDMQIMNILHTLNLFHIINQICQ